MDKEPKSINYDAQKKERGRISKRTIIFIVTMSLLGVILIIGMSILISTNYYVLGGILTGLGGLPVLLVGIYFYLFRT